MSADSVDVAPGETVDLVIIGAGTAGLAIAIFCRRRAPHLRVVCLESARRVGAKILVSGGSRCNVTNRIVTERDFWGGSSRVVHNVLRAFPAKRTTEFFEELGVALHEEDDGKLFPDTNRARTVLDALLDEMRRGGAELHCGRRAIDARRSDGVFTVTTQDGPYRARAVVLATGGRSLPKSGSDGFGYQLAAQLGHGFVDTTPALAPLILAGGRHAALSGISHPAALTLRAGGKATTLHGPLLWTHFGASGPVVLNASRHWHRARIDGLDVGVRLNVCPGETFESLEAWLRGQEAGRPRAIVSTALATRLPAAVADMWAEAAGVHQTTLAHLSREARRQVVRLLLDSALDVRDSRGYNVAEGTADGIPLEEIDPARMASTVCPGLYLVGEILDVDGRLGGFNFQWAWSSAWVAGHVVARALTGAYTATDE